MKVFSLFSDIFPLVTHNVVYSSNFKQFLSVPFVVATTYVGIELLGIELIRIELLGIELMGIELIGKELVGIELVGIELIGIELIGIVLSQQKYEIKLILKSISEY